MPLVRDGLPLLFIPTLRDHTMKDIAIYPKNKAHFLRLLSFGKEIIQLCGRHGTKPILYGSMAHFLHTGDTGMRINDLDFLVPGKKVPGIYNELKREGAVEFLWKIGTIHTPDVMRAAKRAKGKMLIVRFPDSNGTIIVKGDLRVELDDLYKTFEQEKGMLKEFVPLDLDGERIRMISLPGLRKLYRIAHKAEKGKDKAKIRRKIKRLEASLNSSR